MKTFALSMIFSLAVILCEQQTLFAPHYTDFGGKRTAVSKVQSAALPWHRGIPAPNEYYESMDTGILVVDTSAGLAGSRYEEVASSQKNDWTIVGNPSLEAEDPDTVDLWFELVDAGYTRIPLGQTVYGVDLWFELMDAGYTEDEAFDLVEMVIGDHNALGFEGESVNTLTSYEGKLPIAEPLPQRLPVKSY